MWPFLFLTHEDVLVYTYEYFSQFFLQITWYIPPNSLIGAPLPFMN